MDGCPTQRFHVYSRFFFPLNFTLTAWQHYIPVCDFLLFIGSLSKSVQFANHGRILLLVFFTTASRSQEPAIFVGAIESLASTNTADRSHDIGPCLIYFVSFRFYDGVYEEWVC